MKRTIASVMIGASLMLAPVPSIAVDTGPLAPGGAAGVQEAQGLETTPLWVWLSGAVVLGVAVLVATNDDDTTPSAPPTTTTTP